MDFPSSFILQELITLTRAPITPKLVSRKYSKGLVLLAVFRNGYRYNGMCAENNKSFVNISYIIYISKYFTGHKSTCTIISACKMQTHASKLVMQRAGHVTI
jgi:hypothetical protein